MHIKILLLVLGITIFGAYYEYVTQSVAPKQVIITPTIVISTSILPSSEILYPATIGSVTRHVAGFVGKEMQLEGYMLARYPGYAIFSDEIGGAISVYDLPVVGPGIESLVTKQKYILQGVLMSEGLKAMNGNKYHLELSVSPQPLP